MRFCTFIFILSFLFQSELCHADHIAGGDISYEFVGSSNGNNNYVIRLIFYRDCSGIPEASYYDIPWNSDCGQGVVRVIKVSKTALPVSNCVPGCYERIVYEKNLSVSQTCGQILLSWTSSDRSISDDFYLPGTFHIESTIFNQYQNSSSVSNATDFIACLGEPFSMDLNQIFSNPSGNQLTFTLMPPQTTQGTPLDFRPGYTYDNPLQTANGFNLSNGILSFTPINVTGNTVASFLVQEFSGGVLVGQTTKEFTLLIDDCANVNA